MILNLKIALKNQNLGFFPFFILFKIVKNYWKMVQKYFQFYRKILIIFCFLTLLLHRSKKIVVEKSINIMTTNFFLKMVVSKGPLFVTRVELTKT